MLLELQTRVELELAMGLGLGLLLELDLEVWLELLAEHNHLVSYRLLRWLLAKAQNRILLLPYLLEYYAHRLLPCLAASKCLIWPR